MNKLRLNWVDISKGLGIVFVVIGHTEFFYKNFIYVFHMPLFFIISGFLFNCDKFRIDYKAFILSRFKRLMIPYFISCIIFYMFWMFIGRHMGENVGKEVSIFKPLLGIIYANGINDWLIFNTPLWFLPCLFVAEIIFGGILYIFNNSQRYLISGILIATLLGYLVSRVIFLPWGIDIALVSQIFMLTGYVMQKTELIKKFNNNSIRLTIVFFIIIMIAYFINGRVDMNGRIYKNILLFYMGGVCGSYIVFIIANCIDHCRKIKSIVIECGKNTLIILIVHSFSFKFVSAAAVFLFHMPLNLAHQQLWFLYAFVGILIPLYLAELIKYSRMLK